MGAVDVNRFVDITDEWMRAKPGISSLESFKNFRSISESFREVS